MPAKIAVDARKTPARVVVYALAMDTLSLKLGRELKNPLSSKRGLLRSFIETELGFSTPRLKMLNSMATPTLNRITFLTRGDSSIHSQDSEEMPNDSIKPLLKVRRRELNLSRQRPQRLRGPMWRGRT